MYSVLRHLLNHILHPVIFRKEFKKNRIKHIMFTEEAFMLNFLPKGRIIVSCLDVIPLVLPHEVSTKYKMFLEGSYRGMKKASIVLANSNYTKSDIVKYLQIPEKKVCVAYPPIREIFKPIDNLPDEFYKKYDLEMSKKYLLYVGALDLPRKNIKTLLNAFSLVNKQNKEIELLLVGYTTLKGGIEELKEQIERLKIDDFVKIITNVSDDDLVLFYNIANIFLFPSLYEGFGLPPLEAMACKTPVIASHVSSIPEVLGDAALYVDPLNPKDIAMHTEKMLLDDKIRKEKIQAGSKQVKKYTWEAYCDATLRAYRRLQNDQ